MYLKWELNQLPEPQVNPETTQTQNISVTVQNSQEEPVSGASVSIQGTEISSTTGGQGGCTLQNVPEGSQTINVTATGYQNYSDTINVSSSNNEITIILTEEE